MSQEWRHLSAGLEEDMHPECDPLPLSQAGGKARCFPARAEHPQPRPAGPEPGLSVIPRTALPSSGAHPRAPAPSACLLCWDTCGCGLCPPVPCASPV